MTNEVRRIFNVIQLKYKFKKILFQILKVILAVIDIYPMVLFQDFKS